MLRALGLVVVFVAGAAVTVVAALLWGLPAPEQAPPTPAVATGELQAAQARIAELEEEVVLLQEELAADRALVAELEEKLEERPLPEVGFPEGGLLAEEESEGDSQPPPPGPEGWRRGRRGERADLSLEEIRALMTSENRWEQMRALRHLDELPDRAEAMAYALRMLQESQGRERFMALRALQELGGPEAVAAISGLLAGGDEWMVRGAASALGDMGDTAAIPALQSAFGQAQGREALPIAMALRELGDSSAVGQLSQTAMTQLSSPDGGLREDAVRTLGNLRDVSHNVQLVGALSDTNSDVRRAALQVLARQGTASELPAIQALLNDPVAEVARSAERTIQMIQNPPPEREGRMPDIRFGGPGGGGMGGGRRGR